MAVSNVLLTGGNGFIAVHILKQDNAFAEDILRSRAFDQVVKDNTFDAIFHTSSPLVFNVKDVEKDILQPAIKGTTEILKSAKEHGPTIKRVIITSSFAALANSSAHPANHVYTEKDWNPITYEYAVKNPQVAYFASKALAEKAAWEFIRQEKPEFDLVTICPTMVYGPVLQEVTSLSKMNASSLQFYEVFNGQDKELKPFGVWLWVDVRDVATAHVAALEKPEAGGKRFLLAEGNFNIGQVAEYIWTHYAERAEAKGIPRSSPTSGYPSEGVYSADTSAAKNILGIDYIKFEDMLKDQLAQFVALEKELEGAQ
ncbi:hypothetical protein OPQ81_010793 [Rhizoctonia solani]|nr:hypothetical protein OPQ81_010793 [Rhizoctonia solani]